MMAVTEIDIDKLIKGKAEEGMNIIIKEYPEILEDERFVRFIPGILATRSLMFLFTEILNREVYHEDDNRES